MNWVAKHGAEFHYNVEVGRDVTIDELRARHDAVVVATGCMYPVAMNVPGEELDGVIYGVDFLKRANLGQEQWVGEHVVIVGGGYTAMDSSRTALRLGAKTSVVVYRRGPEEMVVDEEEQHETRFEGVRFEYFAAPVEILADEDGHVKGAVFQRTQLGPPDASGTADGGAHPRQRVRDSVRHGHPLHQPVAGQQRPRRVRVAAEPPHRRDRYPRGGARRLDHVVGQPADERLDAHRSRWQKLNALEFD